MHDTVTGTELTEFVQRVKEAAAAYVQGDMDRYLDGMHHADSVTLLTP